MEEWAKVNNIVLERNLYFTDQWLKDLMKGLFNPGGARASYATAEKKGISPLPCRPRSYPQRSSPSSHFSRQQMSPRQTGLWQMQ
jgi:hypothetical protein